MINRLREMGFNTCYHVTPLHHLPLIVSHMALYSNVQIKARDINVAPRPSSSDKDLLLGFADFVHTFLLTWNHGSAKRASTKQLPILRDKLQRGLPHVCLKIPLSFFESPVI